MDANADTVSRDAGRGLSQVCPYLSVLEHANSDTEHLCLSRNNDPITISARYVEAYCLTARHRNCTLYIHAGNEQQYPVTQEESVSSAASAAENSATAGEEQAAPVTKDGRGSTAVDSPQREETPTQPAEAAPPPRNAVEIGRAETWSAPSTPVPADLVDTGLTVVRATRQEPVLPRPARVETAEAASPTPATTSPVQPRVARVVELEPVATTQVEEATPVAAVTSREVPAVPVDVVPLPTAEVATLRRPPEVLTRQEATGRETSLESTPLAVASDVPGSIDQEPQTVSREAVVAEPQAAENPPPQPENQSLSPAPYPPRASTTPAETAGSVIPPPEEAIRQEGETATEPDRPKPVRPAEVASRQPPRTLLLGLVGLGALIVIVAIVLLARGGSHRTGTPKRLATTPSPAVRFRTAIYPPTPASRHAVIAPKPPTSPARPTAAARPTPSTRVAVPPPASAWRFGPVHRSVDTIVLMFSNPNSVPVKTTVLFSNGARAHIRIPAKSGSELELSPQATSTIVIRASAPIITARTLVRGSTTSLDYGVPINQARGKSTP